MECKSLNRGDVFILDNGTKIWVWCGYESNKLERIKVNYLLKATNMKFASNDATTFNRVSTAFCVQYIFSLLGNGNCQRDS